MNEQTQTTAESPVPGHETCAFCRAGGVLSHLAQTLGPSDAVRQYFRQSRIEFLKGIRQIVEDRIETMSKRGQKGTRIVVE